MKPSQEKKLNLQLKHAYCLQEYKMKIIKNKKYLIDDDRYIFENITKLEKAKLSREDKEAVRLIKTQLEADWKKYLIKKLNRLLIKYKIWNKK